MATKPMTDYQRFMHTLNRVAGPPHVRVKSEHLGTTYEKNTTVEKWWCPSCRVSKALQLRHPMWLPYPKPRCTNCSDVEVYEALGLQELAFRGDSPPLVMCTLAKSYRHKTGKWPVLGAETVQWRGACRKCDGCRAFTTQKQAHELSVTWADQLADAADQLDHPSVWVIEIPESDKRRMLDALKYRIDRDGGALAQVPVQGGRVILAAVGHPSHGRITPLLQRLVRDAERLVERREERTTTTSWPCPRTHAHDSIESCFECLFGHTDCDPSDGHERHDSVSSYSVRATLHEQLQRRIYETVQRRVWRIDGRVAKVSFRAPRPPTQTGTAP